MDYSQLSDFEINKRVAIATGQNIKFIFLDDDDNEIGILVGRKGCREKKDFDPCNNPSDAWPIIVDNKISLNSYSGTWEASYEYDAPIGAFGTDEIVTKAVEGKNPRRTAMIAFLMKQEHANA